jgi:hypothetical protein
MTTIEIQTTPSTGLGDDFGLVAVDLYRDIHKGIRAELFAITSVAGSVDPTDRVGRAALADHVVSVGQVLTSHAHHEDAFVDEPLQAHLPDLAERINADHEQLEARFAAITLLAGDLVRVREGDERRLAHLLHLELSGFTSAYLAHQLLEEGLVMPALERAIGVDAVLGIHTAIVTSIPPDEMARSLAFMLPAMNVFDRTELLGGMQAGAPPEAFAGVVSLARSVLHPGDFAALAARLGLA